MAHEHQWRLEEDGYVRTWSTRFDEATRTVVAGDSGMSDEGDGVVLRCQDHACGETTAIPDGWEVDWG